MEEEELTTGFKVKDKRRFDDSGNLKNDSDTKASSSSANNEKRSESVDQVLKGDPKSVNSNKENEQYSSATVEFSSFIFSLATQALMQLGEMPPPAGMKIEKNKQGAKQMIDVIAMLQDKTKGNLTKEEEHLIEEMLHNLRLAYVKNS